MFRIRSCFFLILLLPAALCWMSCSSSKPDDIPTAVQRFRLGMAEYADENYLDAFQHFEVIRLQFPGSPVSDSARYFSGMCRFHREEYLLASYEFTQTIQSNPAGQLVSDAQYMYAECYYSLSPRYPLDQSYTIRAIDGLQTFIELFPTHPRVPDAEKQIKELTEKLAEKEFKTGLLYVKMENYSAALIYFNTVIDKYYTTPFIDDAMMEKLRILIRRKNFTEAGSLITAFLDKYADSPFIGEVRTIKAKIDSAAPPAGTNENSGRK